MTMPSSCRAKGSYFLTSIISLLSSIFYRDGKATTGKATTDSENVRPLRERLRVSTGLFIYLFIYLFKGSPAVSVSKEAVVDSRSNCLQKRPAPPIKQSIIPRDITRLFKQEPAQSRKPSGSRKVVAGPDTTRPSSSGKPVIRDSEFLHSEEALWIKSRAKTTANDRPDEKAESSRPPSGTTKKRPVPRPAETAPTSAKPVVQRDSEFLHSEDALWIRSRAHASAKDNQDRECRSSKPRTREAATAEGKKTVIRPEVVKSSTSGKPVVQRDSEFLHSEEALWIKSRCPASAKEKQDGKRKSSSSRSKEVTADGKPVVRPGTAKPSASGKAVIQHDSEFLHSEEALWIKSRRPASAKEKQDGKRKSSSSRSKEVTADGKPVVRPGTAKPSASGKAVIQRDSEFLHSEEALWIKSRRPASAKEKQDGKRKSSSSRSKEVTADGKPVVRPGTAKPSASGKAVIQRDSEFLHSEEALWIKSRRPASAKEKQDGKRKSSSSRSKEVTADGKPVVSPGTAKPSASGKAVIQRDSEFLHSEDALWIKSRTRARAKEKSDSKHSRSDLKGASADRKTAARPEPAKPATSGKTPAVKQDTKTVVPRPLPKPPTAGSKPDVQNQNNSAEAAAGHKPNLQHSSGHPQARQATVTATTIAKTADVNGKPSKTSCAKTAASRVRSASLPEESGSANPGLSQGPPAETPAAQPKPKRHRKVKKPAIKKAELPPQMPVTPYIPVRYTPGTDCSSNMAGQHPRVADGAVYLNRYEFVKKLGYGAYGMVVKVFDRESQEHKAIKMIDLGTKKSEHKLLRAEIKVLNWLKEKNTVDNVHIVMMESVFQYKNSLCPVLPLYAYDLRTMMKKSKAQTWTLRMLQTVARQLLTALIFLSSSGVDIVHCDIKPENIMLADTKKCDVKLIDFGLALHRSECRKGLRLQTRYYRAPEVVFGTDFDAAIDVWSLGVVLCELYTGKGLFRAKDEKGLVGEFVEVLGECPKKILDKGKFTNRYFDKKDDGEYELTRSGTNAADVGVRC
ncbi:probable serine/threonine-protein kinase dyrk2 [Ptychodera flava]|uniref:probable serine/threonine-protein kinase dyrk2 n=1 Tax=Ptychodera flava TaxID=63121 RepID=UPI00396AA0F7